MNEKLIYIGLAIFGILGPIAFPDYVMQMAVLWMMVLMATTWDITGGQMGYNSLGNITFFGVGMYVSAAIQVSMFYDLGEFTASYGAIKPVFTEAQYYTGLALGVVVAGIACAGVALLLGFLCVRIERALFCDWNAWRCSRRSRNCWYD
jgi:branched-chain amino acid transport system permease protein